MTQRLPAEEMIYAYRGPSDSIWHVNVVFREGEMDGAPLIRIEGRVPDRIPRTHCGKTKYAADCRLHALEEATAALSTERTIAGTGSLGFMTSGMVVDLGAMSTPASNNEAAAALVANPDFVPASSVTAVPPAVTIPPVEDLVAGAAALPPETAPTDPAPPAAPTEETAAPAEDFPISAFGTADHIDRMIAGLEHTMRTQARADYSNTVSELRELAKGIRAGQVGALVNPFADPVD